jgi:hypothetical protein
LDCSIRTSLAAISIQTAAINVSLPLAVLIGAVAFWMLVWRHYLRHHKANRLFVSADQEPTFR